VLVTAPSHAACDAFTLALGRQWPPTQPAGFVRLADGLRLTDPRVSRYLPEHYKVAVATWPKFRNNTLRITLKGRGNKFFRTIPQEKFNIVFSKKF
jgi:hypothetical protein